MSNYPYFELRNETETSKKQLEALSKSLGKLPNVYKVIGNSSTALEALLTFDKKLSGGQLNQKEIEIISLAVSKFNGCNYCLAAHSTLGKLRGLSPEEISAVFNGNDSKYALLITFTNLILENKGKVEEHTVREILEHYTVAQIIEIIGVISKITFTTYINRLADTPIDFPA